MFCPAVLSSLEELRLDRNALRSLPASLIRLSRLRVLTVGYNLLETLPANLLAMRALNLLVSTPCLHVPLSGPARRRYSAPLKLEQPNYLRTAFTRRLEPLQLQRSTTHAC